MPAFAMPVAPMIALGVSGTLGQVLATSDELRECALMSDVSFAWLAPMVLMT